MAKCNQLIPLPFKGLTYLDFAALDNCSAHFLSCSFGVGTVSERHEAESLHGKQTAWTMNTNVNTIANSMSKQKRNRSLDGHCRSSCNREKSIKLLALTVSS